MNRLLSVALMVLVTLVGIVGVSDAVDKEIQTGTTQLQNRQMAVQALQAASNAGVQVKPMYYLTSGQFSGDQASAACSTGFHMASIFEIFDTSHLQYATGLFYAFSDDIVLDQGDDPPTKDFGWVRTGYASTPDPTRDPHESLDCNNGSARLDSDWGTVVRLYDRAAANQMNSEWVGVSARLCNQRYHVWCVEGM